MKWRMVDSWIVTYWLIRRVYGERRNLMLDAMDEFFPQEVTWTHPQGGLFLWGTMPETLNSADVLKRAIEQNVAFVPGAPFYALGGGANTMRINFSFAAPDKMLIGIERLGKVLREMVAESAYRLSRSV